MAEVGKPDAGQELGSPQSSGVDVFRCIGHGVGGVAPEVSCKGPLERLGEVEIDQHQGAQSDQVCPASIDRPRMIVEFSAAEVLPHLTDEEIFD